MAVLDVLARRGITEYDFGLTSVFSLDAVPDPVLTVEISGGAATPSEIVQGLHRLGMDAFLLAPPSTN